MRRYILDRQKKSLLHTQKKNMYWRMFSGSPSATVVSGSLLPSFSLNPARKTMTTAKYQARARPVVLRVYRDEIVEARYHSTTVGWGGVLGLAIYWTARFAPKSRTLLSVVGGTMSCLRCAASLPATMPLISSSAVASTFLWANTPPLGQRSSTIY
jgi:hypothetical protein